MNPMIRSFTSCCLIACALLAVSACGNKGALTLPASPTGTQAKPPAATPSNNQSDHISPPATAKPK
jgi:predicted small lipoprotein YifL